MSVCRTRRAEVAEPGSKADALCCLQNFLSVNGIKFYESKMNLNWKPIIKSIQEVGRSAMASLYALDCLAWPFSHICWASVGIQH